MEEAFCIKERTLTDGSKVYSLIGLYTEVHLAGGMDIAMEIQGKLNALYEDERIVSVETLE